MDRKRLIPIVVLALVVAGTATYFGFNAAAREAVLSRLNAADEPLLGGLKVSGFIEAEEVEIAAEIGGRVTELPFEEGDVVSEGDVLVQLDTSILGAQRDAAQAQLDIITAQRDLIEVTPRPEVIAQAQAQVALAQAALDATTVAWQDAAAIAANPQDIEIQVVDAQTQLAVARERMTGAQVELTSAARALELYYSALDVYELHPNFPGLPLNMTLSPQRYQSAFANLQSAQDAVEGAQALLDTLAAYADNPAALQARVADTYASLQTSQASLERTQAELEALKDGPDAEDLMVAEARIDEAESALDAFDAQIARMTLTAPLDAVIIEEAIHVGELASPGAPLVTLASLDVVELTVYVPEDQLNHVHLDQEVRITVDSFPGKHFEGVVVHISDEAEFTPRGVQTREERVNLVFAVKIRIQNPNHDLKPGMPADAVFD